MTELASIEISTSSIAGPVLPPNVDGLQEYVVTLHRHSDLEDFYRDMESGSELATIPDRTVDAVRRLPTSRNTTYMLTAEEAEQIRQDSRVLAVDLTLEQRGLRPVPHWTETSAYWSKNGLASPNLNWALLRTSLGHEISGWGSDANPETTATVALAASGKNVDVVIVDDLINPGHPEIARNPDGTGGSRLVEYDWGQWNSTVLGAGVPNTTYQYTPNADANNHGAHVTGIAAGNTCGWARDANIYNINPYGTSGNQINPDPYTVLAYVKQFHLNKPVNPATGRRNPTIVNNSWAISPRFLVLGTTPQSAGAITSMQYAGTTYDTQTWGAEDFAFPYKRGSSLPGTGLFIAQNAWRWGVYFPTRDAALEAEIEDLIAAGVVVVNAAGNEWSYVMTPSDDISNHYNDYLVYQQPGQNPITYYPKRGNVSSTPSCIAVGNINSQVIPGKSQSSNTGPRIDIWAPGENIVSAANSSTNSVVDPRDSAYYKTELTGTSMAAPQVTGVLACLLETYPNLTQAQAKDLLSTKLSTLGQISDTGNAELYLGTFTSLDGAANRYLYFYQERALTGETWPKENTNIRTTTGLTWPRPRIRPR